MTLRFLIQVGHHAHLVWAKDFEQARLRAVRRHRLVCREKHERDYFGFVKDSDGRDFKQASQAVSNAPKRSGQVAGYPLVSSGGTSLSYVEIASKIPLSLTVA